MRAFNLDRAMTVHLVQPLTRIGNGHRDIGVPILAYHKIATRDGERQLDDDDSISPTTFALQMKFLVDNGYAVIDLEDALSAMAIGRQCNKCVAITFDGGYHNFYTHAFPTLVERRFRSTLFLVSGFIHERGRRFNSHDYLTWEEVREVHEHGVQIGSSTVNGARLYGAHEAEIEYEIAHSKQIIEDHIGEPVRSFSYPLTFPERDRRFVLRLRELLHTHGYVCGVSTLIGTATAKHDWFFLPRIPMNSNDDIHFFRAKLTGCYNWRHIFQYASQMVRNRRTR